MSGKNSKNYEADYTEPHLREALKEAIKAGDRGGRKGEWSARKSQLLKKTYEAEGGSYKHPEQPTQEQKNLQQWTQQDWTTDDRSEAITEDETKRYLPYDVWRELSPEEKVEAEQSKLQGSKQEKQKVNNTQQTKQKMRNYTS